VDDDAIGRLAGQLDQARTEARQVRERLREQIADLKAENVTLRRKLNEARQRISGLQADLELRTAEAGSADERVSAARAEVDRELRKLRARVTELEAVEHAARRTAGQERELASVRTRLLLDTVIEAAGGLRRELALPPGGEIRPADTVAAVEPAAAPVGRSAPDDDPALLDELLALPQVHLIIDGYNVTKTAWPNSPLHSQRQRLVTALGALVAQRRIEVTVVFDGAELSGPVQLNSPRGVRVRFSPAGVIADEVIRQLVRAEPPGRPVVVVSSDREVAESIVAMGARALGATSLTTRIARS
jgi:predicted RNA-binding protein with PIN domain